MSACNIIVMRVISNVHMNKRKEITRVNNLRIQSQQHFFFMPPPSTPKCQQLSINPSVLRPPHKLPLLPVTPAAPTESLQDLCLWNCSQAPKSGGPAPAPSITKIKVRCRMDYFLQQIFRSWNFSNTPGKSPKHLNKLKPHRACVQQSTVVHFPTASVYPANYNQLSLLQRKFLFTAMLKKKKKKDLRGITPNVLK